MNKLFDLGFYAFVVGGILVLTKNKNGAGLLTAAGNSFAHVEQAATGQKLS